MLRTYRYRLDPTPEQAKRLDGVFGAVRFVYNLALETKIQAYAKGKNLSGFDLIKQLTDLKQECAWLYESPNHALQHAIMHLDSAFINLYKKRGGFPKFKNKKSKQAFHVPRSAQVDFDKERVFIPKVKWVRFHNSRTFTGAIRNATVTKTRTGAYFIAVLVETGLALPSKDVISSDSTIGLDVGIKELVVMSNGQTIPNPKFLASSLSLLRVEQRTLSRRFKRGAREQSKNYQKQRLLVARLHERVTNQRRDFLHKTSTAIVKQYDSICVEDLNVAGMLKNRFLSRAILDTGWASFKRMLMYKCEWYGKNLLEIGRFEPSSRVCSICGWHNKELKLSERTWTCANGHMLERDLNAAINIKTFGLRAQPLSANASH